MEFLIEIDVVIPKVVPNKRELLKDEIRAGLVLREQGVVKLICGIPEGLGNVGIWTAEDEPAMREILDGLPLRKYMTYVVTPLLPVGGDEVEAGGTEVASADL